MQEHGVFSQGFTLQQYREIDQLISAGLQKGRAWNMSVQVYSTAGNIDRAENCFGFMFTNLGDVIANVNGMVIFPNALPNALGDSRSVSGHLMDLYKGLINLGFQNPTAGVNPAVEIVQFFYLPGVIDLQSC